MPKLSMQLNVALVVMLMYDLRVARRNKAKYQEICEMNDSLADRLALSQSQVEYLLKIINKNQSDLDEFDRIALQNLNFEFKKK